MSFSRLRRGLTANVQNTAGYNRVVGSDMTMRFFSSSQLAAWVSHVMTPERLASMYPDGPKVPPPELES